MTPKICGVSLFCQDARDEIGGTISLVGIMPDNIIISSLPAALPKLVIYTRVNVDAYHDCGPIEVFLRTPEGQEIAPNVIEHDIIEKSAMEARQQGNPIIGLIARVEGAPFPVTAGRYLSIIRSSGLEHVTGSISFSIGPEE